MSRKWSVYGYAYCEETPYELDFGVSYRDAQKTGILWVDDYRPFDTKWAPAKPHYIIVEWGSARDRELFAKVPADQVCDEHWLGAPK